MLSEGLLDAWAAAPVVSWRRLAATAPATAPLTSCAAEWEAPKSRRQRSAIQDRRNRRRSAHGRTWRRWSALGATHCLFRGILTLILQNPLWVQGPLYDGFCCGTANRKRLGQPESTAQDFCLNRTGHGCLAIHPSRRVGLQRCKTLEPARCFGGMNRKRDGTTIWEGAPAVELPARSETVFV